MLEHVRNKQEEIRKSISSSIGGQALSDDQLEKSANDYFEKGRNAAVGEVRKFGGREYIKTSSGWKFHGKGGGSKANEHKEGALKHHIEEHHARQKQQEDEDAKKTELGEYAKKAAEANLKKVVKEHHDPEMRTAANAELARRKKEEQPQEKKEVKPKPKVEDPAKVKAKEEWNQRNGWWQKFKEHNLSAYPVDVEEKDVKVNTSGDINSHAVLTWKDPKTGATKNAYTKEFLDRNAAVKWQRTAAISGKAMQIIKKQSNALLASEDIKVANAAAIISIISQTGLRRGDPVKFEKTGNRGVMTLAPENVVVNGSKINFSFTGKSYKHNTAEVNDPTLAKYITNLQKERQGQKFLFATTDSTLDSTFEKVGGKGLKIKDMRTYAACDLARKVLFEDPSAPPPLPSGTVKQQQKVIQDKLKHCYQVVSEKLNNTPAMAKTAYIHPNIIDTWIQSLGASFDIKKGEDGEERKYPTLDEIIKQNPPEATGRINEKDEEECDEYNHPGYLPELEDKAESDGD